MAPCEDSDIQRRRLDQPNPFIVFKRFADEQFSALLNRAFGSNPFVLNPAFSHETLKQDYEKWVKDSHANESPVEHEINQLSQDGDKEDRGSTKCPYRFPATKRLPEQEAGDMCSVFDQQCIKSDSANFDSPQRRPAIPLIYMFASPYSPTNLEHNAEEFRNAGTHLRAAFEDLIRVENGLSMSEQPAQTSNSAESPNEWLRNMVNLITFQKEKPQHLNTDQNHMQRPSADIFGASQVRDETEDDPEDEIRGDCLRKALSSLVASGVFRRPMTVADGFEQNQGEEMPVADGDDEAEDEDIDEEEDGEDIEYEENNMNDEEEMTELAMVEQALYMKHCSDSIICAHLQRRAFELEQGHTTETTESSREKPSILSSITTTQTTTKPDGVVETRVVLNKRFSDGRVVTTERQHTQNPSAERPDHTSSEATRKDCESKNAKDRKGWFWGS